MKKLEVAIFYETSKGYLRELKMNRYQLLEEKWVVVYDEKGISISYSEDIVINLWFAKPMCRVTNSYAVLLCDGKIIKTLAEFPGYRFNSTDDIIFEAGDFTLTMEF